MLLVLPYGTDAAPLPEQTRGAGVRHVVFLSSGAVVDGAAAKAQPDVIAAYHAQVEQQIRATGLAWTFLRLFFPAVNSLSWARQLGGGDVVRGPYAAATASVVHERDVAEAAAAVLSSSSEHVGRIHELTGPQSLTQVEQLAQLGLVLGPDLRSVARWVQDHLADFRRSVDPCRPPSTRRASPGTPYVIDHLLGSRTCAADRQRRSRRWSRVPCR
jgi:uncharacterized protein YbjT (DUF2867 family)